MSNKRLSPKKFFENLDNNTMYLVEEFYDQDVFFQDPLVEIKGREALKSYYANMYKNVQSISWQIPDEINDQDNCALVWKMTLRAKNFNANTPVIVDGISVIKFGGKEGKAVYHRDYFDMGAFVYEGIPVLGGMVRFVKKKMASYHKGSNK